MSWSWSLKVRIKAPGGLIPVGMMVLGQACGLWITEPPSQDADVTGTITSIEIRVSSHEPPISGLWVLVEEDPNVFQPQPPQSRKGYFFVADEITSIVAPTGDGGWMEGDESDLMVGLVVSAWYDDETLVLSSYPSEGAASDVAIER